MIINPLFCDITHARRLVKAVADCGVQPPETLTAVLEGLDALTAASSPADPTKELIRGALNGGAAQAEKMLADYALTKLVAQERTNLRGKLDPEFLQEFCDRLENAGADHILDSLRPSFDHAAKAITDARQVVDVTADATAILNNAGPVELAAWQSIPAAVARLNQIASLAALFGPKAQSFALVDKPHGIELGWLEDRAVMCSTSDLISDSRAFAQPGNDIRRSAWLHVNPKLNTIAAARERGKSPGVVGFWGRR